MSQVVGFRVREGLSSDHKLHINQIGFVVVLAKWCAESISAHENES